MRPAVRVLLGLYMLFNSYTFFIFFAVVMFGFSRRVSWGARKFFLLIMSYLFYAAWNPPFVLLLWFSTVLDWYAAQAIYKSSRARVRNFMLGLSIVGNLGLLSYFKYGNFVLDNFIVLAQWLGWNFHPARMDIILPAGISFYTFQTLSYTIDVYRRSAQPARSFLDYALYVTFFPHTVAGPIMRADQFLPQCEQPPVVSKRHIGWGLCLMVLGLFQKIVIADRMMAPMVDKIFAPAMHSTFITAWAGAVAFAVQIFCDFAGYSTCAIGAAMCLGFALPDNFRFPYAAIGFSDFWRRWHMSLSTWLRDYIYIPLGGNRKGTLRTYGNLMATMLLGGLWHGASWTFVAWGGMHGAFLALERGLKRSLGRLGCWEHWAIRPVLALLTFAAICLTWVFFRAGTFGKAFAMVGVMLTCPANLSHPGLEPFELALLSGVAGVLLLFHYLLRDLTLEEAVGKVPLPVRSLVLAVMICAILTSMSGEDRAFIYFQF